VSFLEATGLATSAHVAIERAANGAPHFDYLEPGATWHAVWFDDVVSTTQALGAIDGDVLPPDVGVVFYGLGAEDPALFARLAEVTR
jgi:spore germination protein YaaH